MRDELDRLLREATLFTLAFAIAIGWSLYQFAHGVATFLDALITHLPPGSNNRFVPFYGEGGGLTWVVGRHVVTLDGMFFGLVELVVVLLVAAIVRRRTAPPS